MYAMGLRLGKMFRDEDYEGIRETIDEIFNLIEYTLYPSEKESDKVKERYYHSLVYLIFSLLGFEVKSELLNAKGRLDMAVIFKDKVYIVEFKIKGTAGECIEQIKEKRYGDRFKSAGKKVIMCGMVFDEREKKLKDCTFRKA